MEQSINQTVGTENRAGGKVEKAFGAEIQQLLDIVIHSLYSQKEIFLRELISNASDALDKLKFLTITEKALVPENHEYQIRLAPDKENKTLKIIDSGIGMSLEEVNEYIGTIAKSGTKLFTHKQEELKNRPELIGQFGVGFYSAFMVADRVILHTQKAGSKNGVIWDSKGGGTYTLEEAPRPEGVGTTITLCLKKELAEGDEAQDFTDFWTLKSLVKKYSDFISWPIKMLEEKEEKEGEKTLTDVVVNSQKAIWLKSPSEVTQEEYKEFYHHISHDFAGSPLKTIHYRAEGTMEFTSLLYLPERKPWNYYTKDFEYGLSLYIKKVFIMDHSRDLLPAFLRFVKGVVDSSDLSLNVSREMLQQDRQVTQIRKNIVGKILSTLKDLMTKERPEYEKFWQEFGATLKEGIATEYQYKEKLSELLIFKNSMNTDYVSLNEYVEKMPPEQKDIYFITGEKIEAVEHSPYLEKLKQKNFMVLFLVDPVDEWVTQELREFKGKKLTSITKEGLDLDSEEEKAKKEEQKKIKIEKFGSLISNMKSSLTEQVKDVVISDRLTETPVCLVSTESGMSAHMERILSQMEQGGREMGGAFGKSKRILEVNVDHPVFSAMMQLPENKQKVWSEILYNQALLTEGSTLPDPVKFTKLVSEMMVASH